MEQKLYKELSKVLIVNPTSPFQQAKKKLYDIDTEYFDNIPRDGEELPQGLNLSLKNKVVAEFNQYVQQLFAADNIHAIVAPILAAANAQYGTAQVDQALPAIRQYLQQEVMFQLLAIHEPQQTAEELEKLYKRACHRTLIEHIAQSNSSDIITFHHALQSHTVWECKAILETVYKQFPL